MENFKEVEREILEKLANYEKGIKYSELRSQFENPNFLNVLCLLVTEDKVRVYGFSKEDTKYPAEVKILRRILSQVASTERKTFEFLKYYGEEKEPIIILKENLRKFLRL